MDSKGYLVFLEEIYPGKFIFSTGIMIQIVFLFLSIRNYIIRAKAHTYGEVQRTDVPVR